MILNKKNVANRLRTQFQGRTGWFDLNIFVIGNGNGADPFPGCPSDANFHYGTPLDGHAFENLEYLR
ncbi:hypothetical protein MPLB_1770009 [Mesorhizobium sp. ORS 3324]|nr:hypothetical protein MPLB_1770009 [Mesorhizobium sp. ORS 3324]